MNWHMPKINEGLQVVRSHTIFSPTNATMIDAAELPTDSSSVSKIVLQRDRLFESALLILCLGEKDNW